MDIKTELLNKIEQYETIIITRHIRPDGDCIGSSLGLRSIIKNSFPNKNVYSVGEDNVEYLEFINTEDNIDESIYDDALLIVVDTATKDRISNSYIDKAKEIVKIDHHIAVENYGSLNYNDEMPSCAAIIADFLFTFDSKLKIDNYGAKCLYLGIVTDTGRFRYSGVNSKVMNIAAKLLEYDFNKEELFNNLYIKSCETLRLEGYVYNNYKTTSNGVSYIYFSRRIQKKYNVNSSDAGNLVNCLDSIKGSIIWIAFIELPNKQIRVRLRSRYISVNELANQFRGGGHAQASGATCVNKKEVKLLISKADQLVKEYKANHLEVL